MDKSVDFYVDRHHIDDIVLKDKNVSVFSLLYRIELHGKQTTLSQYELDKLFEFIKPYYKKDGIENVEF